MAQPTERDSVVAVSWLFPRPGTLPDRGLLLLPCHRHTSCCQTQSKTGKTAHRDTDGGYSGVFPRSTEWRRKAPMSMRSDAAYRSAFLPIRDTGRHRAVLYGRSALPLATRLPGTAVGGFPFGSAALRSEAAPGMTGNGYFSRNARKRTGQRNADGRRQSPAKEEGRRQRPPVLASSVNRGRYSTARFNCVPGRKTGLLRAPIVMGSPV